MKFCENCGAKLSKGDRFCQKCGQAVEINEDDVVEEESTNNKISSTNKYCENCGSLLEEGATFCENCGTKVPVIKTKNTKNHKINKKDEDSFFQYCTSLFTEENWEELWLEQNINNDGEDIGIIFTDLSVVDYTDFGEDDLTDQILFFIQAANEKNKVRYFLLDSSNNWVKEGCDLAVDDRVYTLRKVCNVARPKYLLLLGDTDTVPRISWENECVDSDEYVESDLPYATLHTSSPFSGFDYNYDNILRVGRLPFIPNTNVCEMIANYTSNIKQDIDEIIPFGVTASEWQNTSSYVFRRCTENQCLVSPSFSKEVFSQHVRGDENLLYFNVHGSSVTEYWYGQSGGSYPEASEPLSFDIFTHPFILAVEACYGGKISGIPIKKLSTVYNVFSQNCVSMLASSAIAYGTAMGEGASADILIGRYLHDIKEGYSAGDAYVNGLKELMTKNEVANDMAIKTLVEFSLYGDPSYRRSRNVERKNFSLAKALFGGVQKGIKVPIPDTKRAVQLSLCEVDAKIADPIKKHVVGKYTGFENCKPTFYESAYSKYKQASFGKETDIGNSFVKIYFDNNGKIVKELVSK